MNCARAMDWVLAISQGRREPEAAQEAALSEHIDHCDECADFADRNDPLRAFAGRLSWEPTDDDVAAMRRAVIGSQRVMELAADSRSDGSELASPRPAVAARNWAAAALFGLAVLLLPGGVEQPLEDSPVSAPEIRLMRVAGAAAPAIEGVDRPDARVYEWGGDDLSVVMVVDESLDV